MKTSWPAFFLRCNAERPALAFEEAALARHVRAAHDGHVDDLEKLHAGDLLVAHLAVIGDVAALAVFDAEYVQRVRVSNVSNASDDDDVRQRTRELLLVSTPGRLARLARYRGEGPLRAWVSTVARRLARATRATGASPTSEPPPSPDAPEDAESPEDTVARESDLRRFKAAFEDAVFDLDEDEREVLWMHYVEGATMDALAVHRGSSRAAAVRLLTRAREKLLLAMQKSESHLRASVEHRRLIADNLSIRRVLAAKPAGPPEEEPDA